MILIVFSFFGVLSIVLGFLIREKEMYNLIIGFNFLSQNEKENMKEQVDMSALANAVGLLFYSIGILCIIVGVLFFFHIDIIANILLIILGILPLGVVFYLNKDGQFLK